jgi:Reverse transcriptase (RNA-dependent DNA polymerase)
LNDLLYKGELRRVGVPEKLNHLIMSCLAQSRVTVQVNGVGSGHLTPTRGLCQGCPLSPYLFIISMQFLSKGMDKAVLEGRIKGVNLVPATPRLTHALYADDVIIFEEATKAKIRGLGGILEEFGRHSGLMVNPDKSKIWFSRACDGVCREAILTAIQAKVAGEKEKYLDIYMPNRARGKDWTPQLLEDQFWEMLARWKIGLLSHSGRLTLM